MFHCRESKPHIRDTPTGLGWTFLSASSANSFPQSRTSLSSNPRSSHWRILTPSFPEPDPEQDLEQELELPIRSSKTLNTHTRHVTPSIPLFKHPSRLRNVLSTYASHPGGIVAIANAPTRRNCVRMEVVVLWSAIQPLPLPSVLIWYFVPEVGFGFGFGFGVGVGVGW